MVKGVIHGAVQSESIFTFPVIFLPFLWRFAGSNILRLIQVPLKGIPNPDGSYTGLCFILRPGRISGRKRNSPSAFSMRASSWGILLCSFADNVVSAGKRVSPFCKADGDSDGNLRREWDFGRHIKLMPDQREKISYRFPEADYPAGKR